MGKTQTVTTEKNWPGHDEVRLHVGPTGSVWIGDASGVAEDTCLSPAAFISRHCQAIGPSALLGTAANAPLAVALYNSPVACQVRLGSPQLVGRVLSPAGIVWLLRTAGSVSRLCGAWHIMTDDDCQALSVVAGHTTLGDSHPAWPAVRFVASDTASVRAAERLVQAIVDPRWYYHPFRPSRFSRLFTKLGITTHGVEAYLGSTSVAPDGLSDVARIWSGPAQPTSFSPGRAFFFRLQGNNQNSFSGVLRASRRFVVFLCSVWLAVVDGGRHPELVFDPLRFFGDSVTAAAYEACRTGVWQP